MINLGTGVKGFFITGVKVRSFKVLNAISI
jgi:hypothetical protein